MSHIDRRAYAEMYGPTMGDRVRLGDTELIVEVEEDHTLYGDEVKFGGGKVIRDGMGHKPLDIVLHDDLALVLCLGDLDKKQNQQQ